MRFQLKAIAAAVLAATVAGPALAHHSFAMFDNTKEVVLKGKVTRFEWSNPHIWVEVDVPTRGKVVHWSLEGHSPNILKRSGWKSSDVKPGDTVQIKIHPLKDGRPGGSIVSVTLSDGTVRASAY